MTAFSVNGDLPVLPTEQSHNNNNSLSASPTKPLDSKDKFKASPSKSKFEVSLDDNSFEELKDNNILDKPDNMDYRNS